MGEVCCKRCGARDHVKNGIVRGFQRYLASRAVAISHNDAGAIQSDAITLLFFVIRLAGSDLRLLRASGVCRPWPSRLPSRRFCG